MRQDSKRIHLKQVLDFFIAPFHPFWTFDRLKKNHAIRLSHVLGFLVILFLGLILFDFTSPFQYRTSNIYIANRVGFVIGFALRIIGTSFLLGLIVSRVAKINFNFNMAFPIVVFASPTLLYPLIIYLIEPGYFIFADYFSLIWFSVIIGIGVWKFTALSFLKSFLFALIAMGLFWLITVTFIPYGTLIV